MEVLLKMGIPASAKGFRYIVDSVPILIEDPDTPLFKELYVEVGKKYNTSSANVERCIRTAFKNARCSKADRKIVEYYIGFVNQSNSASLHLLSMRLNEEAELERNAC